MLYPYKFPYLILPILYPCKFPHRFPQPCVIPVLTVLLWSVSQHSHAVPVPTAFLTRFTLACCTCTGGLSDIYPWYLPIMRPSHLYSWPFHAVPIVMFPLNSTFTAPGGWGGSCETGFTSRWHWLGCRGLQQTVTTGCERSCWECSCWDVDWFAGKRFS